MTGNITTSLMPYAFAHLLSGNLLSQQGDSQAQQRSAVQLHHHRGPSGPHRPIWTEVTALQEASLADCSVVAGKLLNFQGPVLSAVLTCSSHGRQQDN